MNIGKPKNFLLSHRGQGWGLNHIFISSPIATDGSIHNLLISKLTFLAWRILLLLFRLLHRHLDQGLDLVHHLEHVAGRPCLLPVSLCLDVAQVPQLRLGLPDVAVAGPAQVGGGALLGVGLRLRRQVQHGAVPRSLPLRVSVNSVGFLLQVLIMLVLLSFVESEI